MGSVNPMSSIMGFGDWILAVLGLVFIVEVLFKVPMGCWVILGIVIAGLCIYDKIG